MNEQLIDLYRYILIEEIDGGGDGVKLEEGGEWLLYVGGGGVEHSTRPLWVSERDWSSIELGRLEEEEKTITLNWIRTNT